MREGEAGALNYSSAGPGTTQHLAAELFKLRTRHRHRAHPYKGSAPALTALIAGEVQLSFSKRVRHHAARKIRAAARACRRPARSAPMCCPTCRR